MAEAERIKAARRGAGVAPRRDPVNQPTIGNWLDAMGYERPGGSGSGEAPPSMAQVWTMPGLRRAAAPTTTRCSQMTQCSPTRPVHRGARAPTASRPTTATCGSASSCPGPTSAARRRRSQAHRDGRGLLRHLAQHLVRPATSGSRPMLLPGPEVQPAATSPPTARRPDRPRAPAGHPRLAVLLGRHRGRRAADPALRTPAARCASRPGRPARPAARPLRPAATYVAGRHRRGVLLRRAPAPAGARQASCRS